MCYKRMSFRSVRFLQMFDLRICRFFSSFVANHGENLNLTGNPTKILKKKPKLLRVWHGKKQRSIEKNEALLRQLRAQKLPGLSKDDRPPDVRMEERIGKLFSARKLLTLYSEQKGYKERITFTNKVLILVKAVDSLEKNESERREQLKNRATQYVMHDLIKDISADISENVREFDCQTIPDLSLALSKHSAGENRHIFKDIQQKLAGCNLNTLSNEDLAKILFAFGKAGLKNSKPMFECLWNEISTRDLAAVNTGDLCNYMWGFSENEIKRDEIFKRIGMEVLTRDANGFEPWMLALLVWVFSTIEILSDEIFALVENALFAQGELKDFPTKDLIAITTAFARKGRLEKKLFRKIEFVVIRRRDLATSHHAHLQEIYQLLQKSPFYMSEMLKIVEHELFPDMINSVFDVFFRPRIAWKQKLLKQQLFRAY